MAAAGAVLRYAVSVTVSTSVNFHVIGLIVLLVGIVESHAPRGPTLGAGPSRGRGYVGGEDNQPGGVLIFPVRMLAAPVGMRVAPDAISARATDCTSDVSEEVVPPEDSVWVVGPAVVVVVVKEDEPEVPLLLPGPAGPGVVVVVGRFAGCVVELAMVVDVGEGPEVTVTG